MLQPRDGEAYDLSPVLAVWGVSVHARCERGKLLNHIKHYTSRILKAWLTPGGILMTISLLALIANPITLGLVGCSPGTDKPNGELIDNPQGPHPYTGIGINGHLELRKTATGAYVTVQVPPWGYYQAEGGSVVCCFDTQEAADAAAKTDKALTQNGFAPEYIQRVVEPLKWHPPENTTLVKAWDSGRETD
jgi:hypothetical protein